MTVGEKKSAACLLRTYQFFCVWLQLAFSTFLFYSFFVPSQQKNERQAILKSFTIPYLHQQPPSSVLCFLFSNSNSIVFAFIVFASLRSKKLRIETTFRDKCLYFMFDMILRIFYLFFFLLRPSVNIVKLRKIDLKLSHVAKYYSSKGAKEIRKEFIKKYLQSLAR